MIFSITQQAVILLVAGILLSLPGLPLVYLFRLRGVLPDSLVVVAGALFGIAIASIATVIQLSFKLNSWWAIGTYLFLSSVLIVISLITSKKIDNKEEISEIKVAPGWSLWTTIILLATVCFSWVIRGAIKLDGLYHVSVTRKLIELSHPSFGNVNRFADGGVNPTYALPSWHAFVGWVAQLSGADPIQAWEIMPVLIIGLGLLAAAGMSRVLLGTVRAEVLGAGVWAIFRIFYARREVDGDAILYGAVPGQITFELVFPLLFALIAVAMWERSSLVVRKLLILCGVCIALLVVLHANYVPYVALVGAGYVVWWVVNGPLRQGQWKRTLIVGGVIAAFSVTFMGVLLPILASLENFGNPAEEARIDYHLTKTLGMEHIRGGHLYEMLGLPGLVAILVMPIVAARWRSRELAVASGGLLLVGAMSLIPQGYAVLRATGSLTVGLRINHIFDVLLVPMLAGALLLVAEQFEQKLLNKRLWLRIAIPFVFLVLLVVISVFVGYQRFASDIPGYLAWGALVCVWVWKLTQRVKGNIFLRSEPAPTFMATNIPPDRARGFDLPNPNNAIYVSGRVLAITVIVFVVGIGFPSGAISMRRAYANIQPINAGIHTGDLVCLGGPVAKELTKVDPGSVIISDPATSFRAMALAPVYVVGDYKVWNSPTKDNRTVKRLAQVNAFFDTSLSDTERLKVLLQRNASYLLVDVQDGRWFNEYDKRGAKRNEVKLLDGVTQRLDRFADIQAYSGRGIVALVIRHPEVFKMLALDPRSKVAAIPSRPGKPPVCQSFALWKVDLDAVKQIRGVKE